MSTHALPAAPAATMRAIASLSDIEAVKAAIWTKYGFECTDAYAADFVAFVDEIVYMMDTVLVGVERVTEHEPRS